MTIDEAIEILTLDVKGSTKIAYDDWQSALNLGIEALKRCKYLEEHTDRWARVLLPGETKE